MVRADAATALATTVATDAQGRAATTLTLGRAAGANAVTATAAGLTGSPITFTATGRAGPAARLVKVSGDAQSGGVGTLLPNALVVQVNDANDNPVASAALTFAVSAGGGAVAPATATTDTAGRASTRLTLGQAAGANTVTVSGSGLTAVTFSATGNALPPSTLAISAGDAQSARIGMQVPGPLVVRVGNSSGAPVPGVMVGFLVVAGGGTLSTASAMTDAQGLASTQLTVGPNLGSNQVRATVTGLTAVTFTATGTPLTYAQDVRPVLQSKCTVCHGPGGVFQSAPLTTYTQVRNGVTLVGAQPYVVPNNTAMSVIVQKTQPGGSMADKLTPAEAKLVLDWVRTGAIDGGAPQVPTSVTIVSGNVQQGQPSTALPNPLVVVVRDAANTAVSGVTVNWTVLTGGGTLSAATSTTDILGQALVRWTLGPAAGANTARASVGALTPAGFSANAVAGYSGAPLVGSTNPLDVAALSVLRAQNVEPAPLCTDGEFARRTTGNLLGRLPTEPELTAFLADPAATRRALLVDRLLATQEFADFWAKQIIAPWVEVPATVQEDVNGVVTTFTFDAALVNDVATDTSLKTIVTRFATGQGEEGNAFRVQHNGNGGNSMADVLMWSFTGMTSKCARCHDHPLTQPTDDPRFVQDDNYGLYAFFATSNGAATKLNKSGQRFGTAVQPRFVIDGYANVPPANVTLATPLADRRARFAQLFVESDAFARGTAHRIWTEIAAPLLDPNQFLKANLDAVASKPLLDALTAAFKAQNGSVKGFLRLAMGSRLYQLSSRGTTTAADRYQGRYVLRRHHSETLEKGVHATAGVNFSANQIFGFNFGAPTRGSLESRRDGVSLEQALIQLNSPISTPGKVTASAAMIGTLATQVDGNTITFDQAVTRIVRLGLSRDPTPAELTAARTARAGAPTTRSALEDVAVVVGASTEFMFR
jgi:adhesin/invasin